MFLFIKTEIPEPKVIFLLSVCKAKILFNFFNILLS